MEFESTKLEEAHLKDNEEKTAPIAEELSRDSSSSKDEDETEYPKGTVRAIIVAALLLNIFLVALDMTILATAIPRITDEFQSVDQVGWYGSSFFLTLAVFQSFWGKMYRYCDLKRSFLAAGMIFEIGSLICGVSQSSAMLIAGRAITGWGAAGMFGGTYTIIAFVVPPSKRPAYTGIVGTAYAVASVAGPLLGGAFVDDATWRWCFYVNLPIGGLGLALVAIFFRAPKSARSSISSWVALLDQFDFPGVVVILAALVCFILVTQWAGVTKAWDSPAVIVCLVFTGVLTLVFTALQWTRGEKATIIPRIFGSRNMMGLCAFAFFQNGTNFLLTYYLPIYFQAIKGTTAAQSGIYSLPLIVGSCLCAALSGYLVILVGFGRPFMVLGSSLFIIGAGLIYTLGIGTPLANAIGYQVILGIGQGTGIQMPVIVGQAFSNEVDMSSSTAIILFFQMMGGTVCISAGQSIFSNYLLNSMRSIAPSVQAGTVLTSGASDIRAAFEGDQLQDILISYMRGLQSAFVLAIALAGFAFLAAWVPRWQRISPRKETSQEATDLEARRGLKY